MRRLLLRAVPIAVLAGAAVVGAVLLWTQPWSGEPAAGQPTEYRLCNLVFQFPPESSEFQIRPLAMDAFYGGRPILVVDLKRARVSTDPQTGEAKVTESPGLVVDAETGDVLDEQYFTPADEAAFKELLAAIRVEPFDAANAPWPYSDATTAAVRRERFPPNGGAEVRLPDPGSGLVLTYRSRLSPELDVHTCKSTMRIELNSGKVLKEDIHPDDAAAFETFRAEVAEGGSS